MVPLDFAASWTRRGSQGLAELGLWEGGTAAGSGSVCGSAGLGQTAAIWTCTPLSWRRQ